MAGYLLMSKNERINYIHLCSRVGTSKYGIEEVTGKWPRLRQHLIDGASQSPTTQLRQWLSHCRVKTRLMRDVFLLRKMCQRPPIDHGPSLSFMSFTARGRENKNLLKCTQVTYSRFAVSDPIEI